MIEHIVEWDKKELIRRYGTNFSNLMEGMIIYDETRTAPGVVAKVVGKVTKVVENDEQIKVYMEIQDEYKNNLQKVGVSITDNTPTNRTPLVFGSYIIKKVNEEIIEKYSKTEINRKFNEECIELLKELQDNSKGKDNIIDVIEEIADVQLMLWQLIYKYRQEDKQIRYKINNMMYYKICRTEHQLDTGEL